MYMMTLKVAKDCHTLILCLKFAKKVRFGNVNNCRGGGGGGTSGGGGSSRGKWCPPPPEADNDLYSDVSDVELIEYAVS
jgi:hypothetical protein